MEKMMICNRAGECGEDCVSGHKLPHKHKAACEVYCGYPEWMGKDCHCIPYKPEVKMFKVGDKVRLNKNPKGYAEDYGLIPENIYTVSGLKFGCIRISESNNKEWCFSASDFQLAEDFMENKNYEAACKVIDGMTAICGDGKKEVKKLVASILGVEVKEERTYRCGDVITIRNTYYQIVPTDQPYKILLSNLLKGSHYTGAKEVDFWDTITQKEIEGICGDFTYIGHASDVLKVIEP